MNVKSLVLAVAAAAALTPAFAQEQVFDSSKVVSTRSRAQVLAELELYRASGLAELERHDSIDFTSPAYQLAQRLYTGLRTSSNFDRVVKAIATQRGEIMNTAAGETAVRTQQ